MRLVSVLQPNSEYEHETSACTLALDFERDGGLPANSRPNDTGHLARVIDRYHPAEIVRADSQSTIISSLYLIGAVTGLAAIDDHYLGYHRASIFHMPSLQRAVWRAKPSQPEAMGNVTESGMFRHLDYSSQEYDGNLRFQCSLAHPVHYENDFESGYLRYIKLLKVQAVETKKRYYCPHLMIASALSRAISQPATQAMKREV